MQTRIEVTSKPISLSAGHATLRRSRVLRVLRGILARLSTS
jgi:hypothetical protein